jgi:hypothetical protein
MTPDKTKTLSTSNPSYNRGDERRERKEERKDLLPPNVADPRAAPPDLLAPLEVEASKC